MTIPSPFMITLDRMYVIDLPEAVYETNKVDLLFNILFIV